MKKHQFLITARNRIETLERIFRVVRHRGSRVNSLNVKQLSQDDMLYIDLLVTSERPVELLSSQLKKLIDVQQVEVIQHV